MPSFLVNCVFINVQANYVNTKDLDSIGTSSPLDL